MERTYNKFIENKSEINLYQNLVENVLDLLFAIDKMNICCLILNRINKIILENKSWNNEDFDLKLFLISMVSFNMTFLFIQDSNDTIKSLMKIVLKNYVLTQKLDRVVINSTLIEKLKKFYKLLKMENYIYVKDKQIKDTINLKNLIFKNKTFDDIHHMLSKLLKVHNTISIINLISILYKSILFQIISIKQDDEKNNSILNKAFRNLSIINKSKLISCLIPFPPFLPKQIEYYYKFSLVLDLDETLIHNVITSKGNFFLVRPGAIEFLSALSIFYEIIIFTASAQDYADNILNRLDPGGKLIRQKLYRQHITYEQNSSKYKDLSKIGRDLSKVIIIDNSPENFKYHKENGIPILTWEKEPFDNKLDLLIKLLIKAAHSDGEDIREIISHLLL